MRVLLDTCVLSELHRETGLSLVRDALASLADDDIYLSVLSVGELTKGITLLPESRRKTDLTAWLFSLQQQYAKRILPITSDITSIWGSITATVQSKGIALPAVDGLLAAMALRHGLYVMTRNVKDFKETGVMLLNPWLDV
jgi:toxin FitB